MIVVGVDPGLSGAIAKLEDRRCVAVTDIPTRKKFDDEDNNKQKIDSRPFIRLLADWKPNRIVIEKVQMSTTYGGKPIYCPVCNKQKNGVNASAGMNFGHAAGSIEGACEAYIELIDPTCEIVLIPPGTWKTRAGIEGDDRKNKEVSRQLAIKLFPEAAHHLLRKMDSDRAEAMLIGLYGGYPPAIERPAGGTSRRKKVVKEQPGLI